MTKKLLYFLLLAVVTSLTAQSTQAQSTATIELSKIESNDEMVEVSLSSTEDFIVGGNRYILHIGGAHYKYSKHPKGDVKTITFLIPAADFAALPDGEELVLVYGLYPLNTQQDGESSQQNGFDGPNWSAGKLNKSLLNR